MHTRIRSYWLHLVICFFSSSSSSCNNNLNNNDSYLDLPLLPCSEQTNRIFLVPTARKEMAVSAFRSTSKRGTVTATLGAKNGRRQEDSGKAGQPRRSRSLSAVSRVVVPVEERAMAPVVGFANTRDNPLFSASGVSPTEEGSGKSSGGEEERRGRPVIGGSDCFGSSGGWLSGSRKGTGRRSLSMVDAGRRRRPPSRASSRNYKSEVEQERKCHSVSKSRSNWSGGCDSSDKAKFGVVSDEDEVLSKQSSLRIRSSRDRFPKTRDGSPISSLRCKATRKWGNEVSASYISDAEEKTIKSVCEQIKTDHPLGEAGAHGIYETVQAEVRRAMLEIRSDLQNVIQKEPFALITAADVADIPPELVDPDAMLLTSAIRRDYAVKLEQSQERARKLQAKLDAEEECSQELKKILKEIHPDPKTSEEQKSRLRRKTSIERINMSKRLTEEALNYFDDCVSISTFDSADFSSLDDPSPSSVALHDSSRVVCGPGMSGHSVVNSSGDQHVHNKESDSPYSFSFSGTNLTANSSSFSSIKDTILMQDNEVQDNQVENVAAPRNNMFHVISEAHDIRHLAKKFQKRMHKDGIEHSIVCKKYNPDDHVLKMSAETLLCEKVILRNRIDSGGLLLCNSRFW